MVSSVFTVISCNKRSIVNIPYIDISGDVSDEELRKFFDDISLKFPVAIDFLVKNDIIVEGPAYLDEQIPDFAEKLAELFA